MSGVIEWGNAVAWRRPDAAPTASEMFEQAQRHFEVVDRIGAARDHMYEAFDLRNDEIRAWTGVELKNPYREADQVARLQGRGLDADALRERYVADYMARLRALVAERPEHAGVFNAAVDPREWVRRRAAEVEKRSAELAERAGMVQAEQIAVIGSVPVVREAAATVANLVKAPRLTIAQAAGSLWASVPTPANPETLPDFLINIVGFGRTGASKSLVKNASRNAIDSAAAEAVAQPFRQAQRADLGLEYGWSKAFEAISGAAGAGAGLDLAIRAPTRGALQRFGRDTPAGTWFSREGRGGVFADYEAPRGKIGAETLRKADAGDVDALEEVAIKSGAIDDPAVRGAINHARLGGAADEVTLAEIKAAGLDVGESMALLAHGVRGRYARTAEPIPEAKAPLALDRASALRERHGDAIDAAMADLPAPVARAVAVGLNAGLPEVVQAVAAAVARETPLAPALIEEVGALVKRMGAEKAGDLLTLHDGQASLADLATAMRRSPELVDSNVSLALDARRQARSLAALDDGAFEAAVRGEVSAAVAAHVADAVPPGLHGQAIEVARGARDLAEAVARIDEMPMARPAPVRGGLDDPTGPAAQAEIDRLRLGAERQIEAASADLQARDAAADRVETLKGEIAGLEHAATRRAYHDPATGTPLSSGEVDSIVSMWRYVAEQRAVKAPQRLTQWLIAAGRVQDEAGELTAILGGKSRHLISGRGMSLDDAALKAWEAGFVDRPERPTVADFLEMIRDDIHNGDVVRVADRGVLADKALAAQMEVDLDAYGIGKQRSEAAVRKHFEGRGPAGAGGGAAAAEAQKRVADLAGKRAELVRAERDLAAAEKRVSEALASEREPLRQDMAIVDRLGQLGDIIQACRA